MKRLLLILSICTLILFGKFFNWTETIYHCFCLSKFYSEEKNCFRTDTDDYKQYMFKESEIPSNASTRQIVLYQIISNCREIINSISFREVFTKRLYKNQILLADLVNNSCLSRKLEFEFYTVGTGKLRF